MGSWDNGRTTLSMRIFWEKKREPPAEFGHVTQGEEEGLRCVSVSHIMSQKTGTPIKWIYIASFSSLNITEIDESVYFQPR